MHISTRLILGGSQEDTVAACQGQAEAGHTVSLVYGPIYGPEGSMLPVVQAFRTADGRGIETVETPRLTRELHPFKDPRCCSDLRALIRKWKPDVVHTHSSKAGILGRIAAWREQVPCVVHTVHGPPFHAYEKKWRNALFIMAERAAARHCHRIICCAQAMQDQFLAAKIGKPDQYRIVYSGIDVQPYLSPASINPSWTRDHVRNSMGLSPEDFVLGTVARLAELKGHDDLLDALGDAMKSDRRLKLLWVGDGWLRDRLVQRIESLGLSQQVILTGLVPPREVPKHLRAMDALAQPSYREGLPRTIVQALLSAVPVIAYDVDGTREVCIDGGTGRLLKVGDLTGLREAVMWMRDHPAERAAMGLRGREDCRVRFSTASMVEGNQHVYDEVLKSRR